MTNSLLDVSRKFENCELWHRGLFWVSRMGEAPVAPQAMCTKPHRAGGRAPLRGRVRRLPAHSVWSGPPSVNHGLLSLCSSHVLGPLPQQAKPRVPSWRSLRSSWFLSDTPVRENAHICALSTRFFLSLSFRTPSSRSARIVPILLILTLLTAYLL